MLLSGFTMLSQAQEQLVIAISRGTGSESYLAYGKWLENIDPGIKWIDMNGYQPDAAVKVLETCSGLLLSGGVDIYPGRFGKESDTARCDTIDHKRDTLELALMKKAKEMALPILGICRGLQILNVAFGGSLIIDIPQDKASTIHRCPDKFNCFHVVSLFPGSMINTVSGLTSGTTNTNHHQGIERLADVFTASGWSEDGLVEVIEWKRPENKPYLLGIQWHPERMDLSNPLSSTVGRSFIEATRQYHLDHPR